MHRRILIRFDAIDLEAGLERVRRERHAGDQAAATDRHDETFELRSLRQEFGGHRALARDHQRVVVRMDQREILFRGEL